MFSDGHPGLVRFTSYVISLVSLQLKTQERLNGKAHPLIEIALR